MHRFTAMARAHQRQLVRAEAVVHQPSVFNERSACSGFSALRVKLRESGSPADAISLPLESTTAIEP